MLENAILNASETDRNASTPTTQRRQCVENSSDVWRDDEIIRKVVSGDVDMIREYRVEPKLSTPSKKRPMVGVVDLGSTSD